MPASRLLEHRPRRETDHEPGHTGGREQADTVLPHRLERHQGGAHRDQDDERVRGTLEDAHLRHVLAGEQVVRGVALEARQIKALAVSIAIWAIQPASTMKAISRRRPSGSITTGLNGVDGSTTASAKATSANRSGPVVRRRSSAGAGGVRRTRAGARSR